MRTHAQRLRTPFALRAHEMKNANHKTVAEPIRVVRQSESSTMENIVGSVKIIKNERTTTTAAAAVATMYSEKKME